MTTRMRSSTTRSLVTGPHCPPPLAGSRRAPAAGAVPVRHQARREPRDGADSAGTAAQAPGEDGEPGEPEPGDEQAGAGDGPLEVVGGGRVPHAAQGSTEDGDGHGKKPADRC